MSYDVTITYTGVEKDVDKLSMQICRFFDPHNSYADSAVYTQGYPIDAEDEDKEYGKSVYATNVPGFGATTPVEPYASTSVPFPTPLAQFKLAIVGEEDEDGNHYVTFTVEDYKEAMYYQTLGAQLADQGFTVTVSGSDSSDSNGGDGGNSGNDEP